MPRSGRSNQPGRRPQTPGAPANARNAKAAGKKRSGADQPKGSPGIERALREAYQYVYNGNPGPALHPLTVMAERAPKDFRVWEMLMTAYMGLGRYPEAAKAGEKAVHLSPKQPEIHVGLGKAYQRSGRYDEALEEFERALYYKPRDPKILHCKFTVFSETAKTDRALETLAQVEHAIEEQKLDVHEHLGVFIDKAGLSPKHIDPREVIRDLDPLAADTRNFPKFREVANHHLGRLYEHLGEYDTAFDRYEACNAAVEHAWDPDAFSAYVTKLIKCWEGIDKVPPAPIGGGERLIFITGMMRSGTSLAEQMISQLPRVTPGGEMNAVTRAVQTIEPVPHPMGPDTRPFPITRLSYTAKTINAMARKAWPYFNEVAREGFVTDKQPHNVFYAPLIARLFPGCKIINCRRDPLDNCLSNFVQTYARDHPQTHDLYWLGRFYRDYERMSEVWSSLDEVGIYDLNYEALVEDPETETKKLCAYLGMEWSEAMLAFHESDRTVRTASRNQVRQPLYKSSVKRHEHFTHRLGELYRGLGLEPPDSPPPDPTPEPPHEPPPDDA